MKSTLLWFCLIFFSLQPFAQKFSITGQISDTTNKTVLQNASIVLLKNKDSSLVKFTRAAANGSFNLNNVDSGNYVLLITYPGYADYVDLISVEKDVTLGNLILITKAVALQNVIVRGSPIRMKGDTLAYTADSFKVREGATVEDLLKKLPGIQVNSKGEITAQGEKVRKVLVDGEEFFGDDPTMATKNLQAKIVKEVQVFDKKSEQATFTGIDDGEQTKTINLKLKDEAKNGYFGKLDLAAGLPKNYNNELMLNKFTKSKKISVFGLMSNVNKAGLGWEEETNYGGGINTQVNDDGGVSMWFEGDNIDNDRDGLPTAINVGGHFNNKWDAEKQKINGSYRFRNLEIDGGSNVTTQFILPDTQYINNEKSNFNSKRFLNKANLSYDYKIDSTQSLLVIVRGSYGKNDLTSNYISESLSPKGLPINQSIRQTVNTTYTGDANSNLVWRKRLKKKGRTISTSFDQNYRSSNGDGFLRNYNQFYANGSLIGKDTTDQKKENENFNFGLNSRVAYTEPVGKKGIIEVNYAIGFTNSENKQLSYDKVGGSYTQLNKFFSNSFAYHTLSNNIGTSYKFTEKKYNFQLGGNVIKNNWRQEDLIRDSTTKRNFTNFNGRARFYYKLKQQSGLRFNYYVNSENPSINQLQPLADNNDPLNIMIGNPNLKLSLNHNFEVNYNMFQVLSGRSIWSSFSYEPITNDISTKDSVDNLGRKYTQYTNVDGNYRMNVYISGEQQIKAWDMEAGINFSYSKSVRNNIVNSIANRAISHRLEPGIYLSKGKEDKYDVTVEAKFSYNSSTSSIRNDIKTNYWTFEPNVNLTLELPWKIHFSTNANYYIRQKTEVFANNNNVLLWNANIDKKISKKQDMRIGLMVNDILNQNQGFSREISSNFITERSNVVLRRYGLITFSWKFNKNGKPQEW